MSGDGAAPREEDDDIEFVMIKGRKRLIGENITADWKGAIDKEKMAQTFGPRWRDQKLQGVISGYGTRPKIRVQWTNLLGQPFGEYDPQHGIWKIPSEDQSENT